MALRQKLVDCFTVKGMTQEKVNTFTQEDFNFSSFQPKYQVGDRCYLTEPTLVIVLTLKNALVQYDWKAGRKFLLITENDLSSLNGRSTGIYTKQNQRFMLKSFARYHILIESVGVERLFDITAQGAIAEGIKKPLGSAYTAPECLLWWDYVTERYIHSDPRVSYFSEIAKIYEKKGGWDFVKENPWMWFYKFRLVES
jgi:hypothetical protein